MIHKCCSRVGDARRVNPKVHSYNGINVVPTVELCNHRHARARPVTVDDKDYNRDQADNSLVSIRELTKQRARCS